MAASTAIPESLSGAGAGSGITQSSKAAAEASVNFDTFLRLLATQLQNQDPLNPMDGTAFTEQIATFSGLEQQIATNSYLEKLVNQSDFSPQLLAVSYIGKEVLIKGKEFDVYNNKGTFTYDLEEAAYSAQIEIKDADGKVVRTVDGSTAAGAHEISWDGKSDEGAQLKDGKYTVNVTAYTKDGDKLEANVYTYGLVTAVDGSGSDIVLATKDGRNVKLSDVNSVRGSQTTEAKATLEELYLGNSVYAAGIEGKLENGHMPIAFELTKKYSHVVMEVLDETGKVVANLGDSGVAGLHQIDLAGIAQQEHLPDGKYTVRAVAMKEDDSFDVINISYSGLVTAVQGSTTNGLLTLADGTEIPVSSVIGVVDL